MASTLFAPPFDRNARKAFVIACAVLLTSGVGFQWAVARLNVYLRKEPVEMRGSFATMPRTLGRWKAVGREPVVDAATLEELGTNKVFQLNYSIDGKYNGDVLNVHLAYYTGMIDAVPHVPDRCMAAAGYTIQVRPANFPIAVDRSKWEPDGEYAGAPDAADHWMVNARDDRIGQTKRVPMPTGDFMLRTTEFSDDHQPGIRVFGGYFFVANNRVTPIPEGVKAMAFRPSEKYAYYCKVQFIYLNSEATREKYLALVSDMLTDLLPELMNRLPDWAEVQRRDSTQTVPTKVKSPER